MVKWDERNHNRKLKFENMRKKKFPSFYLHLVEVTPSPAMWVFMSYTFA